MSSDRTDRLSKLAWEAQRRGDKGESALDKLQREAKALYPAQWEEALEKAARRARRTGRVAYVVFAPTMHRAYAKHAHQAGWYRRHLWPFSVHTNPHTTRATAPILWSTSEGYRVHYWTERRRSRNVAAGHARDKKRAPLFEKGDRVRGPGFSGTGTVLGPSHLDWGPSGHAYHVRDARGVTHSIYASEMRRIRKGQRDAERSKGREKYTVVTERSRLGRWLRTRSEAESIASLWRRHGLKEVRVLDSRGREVKTDGRDRARRHRHRVAGAPTFKQQATIERKIRLLEHENRRRKVKRSRAQIEAIAYRYAGVPARRARKKY